MSAFFGSFITYVIEMICMVLLGLCGGYVGVKLRERKNAKEGMVGVGEDVK